MRKVMTRASFALCVLAVLLSACTIPTPPIPVATPSSTVPVSTSVPISSTTQPLPAASATSAPATSSAPASQPTAAPTTAAQPTGLVNKDLHQIDWATVLANDPNLDHPQVPPDPGGAGPYVAVKSLPKTQIAAGYAVLKGILYTDIGGDSQDEAIISLFSGGTAGNLGLLVYRAGNPGPVLVAALPGYKIGAVADPTNKQLIVRQPQYPAWAANCCPSGFLDVHYKLQNNALVEVSRVSRGEPGALVPTVQTYYSLLSQKDYQAAYAFLSPKFQASNPYTQFALGYSNTISLTTTINDLDPNAAPNAVSVDLVSSDKTVGGTVQHHFNGVWKLIWSEKNNQWLLDQGTFSAVK